MTGSKINRIQELHRKVVHSTNHETGYRELEYLLEDKLVKQCAGALLTMICKSCFPVSNAPTSIESECPSCVVNEVLLKHGLRWKTAPYRIETNRGNVVSKGPLFDLSAEVLERSKGAAAKARQRERQ